MATLISIVNEAIQRTGVPTNHLIRVVNEEISRRRDLVQVVNEVIQRAGSFASVQVINETSRVQEGPLRQYITTTPLIQVINETAQSQDDSIHSTVSVVANHLIQTVLEGVATPETGIRQLEYIVPPAAPYGPGVRGKHSFRRWYDCAICGFSYPENELYRQRGVLVCKDDLDDKSHSDYVREGSAHGEEPRGAPWLPDGD